MTIKTVRLIVLLLATIGGPLSLDASTGDLSTVIESFVVKQFPQAQKHFWVVNGTQWQADDEMVVDINTIVTDRTDASPTENRFLLLIVEGRLAAAQNIPLEGQPECQPEQQA
jgi:hypothetical protein